MIVCKNLFFTNHTFDICKKRTVQKNESGKKTITIDMSLEKSNFCVLQKSMVH